MSRQVLTENLVDLLYKEMAVYFYSTSNLQEMKMDLLNENNHGASPSEYHPVINYIYNSFIGKNGKNNVLKLIEHVNSSLLHEGLRITESSALTHLGYIVYKNSYLKNPKVLARRRVFYKAFNNLIIEGLNNGKIEIPKKNPFEIKEELTVPESAKNPFGHTSPVIPTVQLELPIEEPKDLKNKILELMKKDQKDWTYSKIEELFTEILAHVSTLPIQL
jgi:hypothetical protein